MKKLNIRKQSGEKASTESLETNFNLTLQNLMNLNDENRIKIFVNIKNKREIPFDFFQVYSDYKRSNLSGNKIHPLVIGGNYTMIKSMLRKRLLTLQTINENDQKDMYISLDDISKLSLKDRISYKNYQKEMNSKHNIYEDIREYIREELNNQNELDKLKSFTSPDKIDNISSMETNKFENRIDEIFEKIVIKDLNEIIINNILDNKKIFIALVIVRSERLNNLYEKLKDHNEKLKI